MAVMVLNPEGIAISLLSMVCVSLAAMVYGFLTMPIPQRLQPAYDCIVTQVPALQLQLKTVDMHKLGYICTGFTNGIAGGKMLAMFQKGIDFTPLTT